MDVRRFHVSRVRGVLAIWDIADKNCPNVVRPIVARHYESSFWEWLTRYQHTPCEAHVYQLRFMVGDKYSTSSRNA